MGDTDFFPHVYALIFHVTNGNAFPTFRSYYVSYIRGLQQYVTGEAAMREGVESNAEGLIISMQLINAPVNYSASDIYKHVISGAFFDDLAAGTWTLLPGTPHFRGLTGCGFL